MKHLIIFIFLIAGFYSSYAQDKPKSPAPALKDAKAQIVLRGTTRDQVSIVKDNLHQKQVLKRKQAAVKRQQMMVKKRMQRIQKQRVVQQRNIQKRRMKQQAVRQQQSRKR
jgi:hypothetical protein